MVQKRFTNTSKFWRNFGKNKNPKFELLEILAKIKEPIFLADLDVKGGFLFLSPRYRGDKNKNHPNH